jgi:DNA-binding XRE family transcriptional regulator
VSKRDETDWTQVELEVFGTTDHDQVCQSIQRSSDAYLRRQSTFGGYLKTLRRQLGFTMNEMAGYAEVAPLAWSSWEANMHLPSAQTVFEVVDRLKLEHEVKEKLLDLLVYAPQQFVHQLSFFCLEKCAAEGPQMLDVAGMWKGFPPKARSLLLAWADKAGHKFPDELVYVIRELNGEDGREAWVNEVLDEAPLSGGTK